MKCPKCDNEKYFCKAIGVEDLYMCACCRTIFYGNGEIVRPKCDIAKGETITFKGITFKGLEKLEENNEMS